MQKNINLIFILFFSFNLVNISFAQKNTFYPFSNSIVLGLNGGFSKAETDYSNSNLGMEGSGTLEYFFNSNSDFSLGLKLSAGYTTLNGQRLISNTINTFESDIISLGTGISANYRIREKIVPFVTLEAQNIWVRDETALNFIGGLGLRYILSNNVSVAGSLGFNFVNADHLDNLIVKNTNNDYYTTFSIGISYAIELKAPNDTDDDGIIDSRDKCPNQKEDFDGFQDNDGCADLDNDNDGILDVNDHCPNDAEDFDGFQDNDGCPDLDNDGDAILDKDDECPDTKEDFDGFQDDDGCPDLDNDNDGILDKNDLCPNKPETFNSFEDTDGCPDKLPEMHIIDEEETQIQSNIEENKPTKKSKNNSIPNEFFLSGELTFADGTATLKSSVLKKLNKIAKTIKKHPGYKWKIEGHMDNSGSPFAIKALSTARANSVLNYLVSAGVSPDIFEVVGLGDKYPTSSNSTENGRKKNRRVVIKRVK